MKTTQLEQQKEKKIEQFKRLLKIINHKGRNKKKKRTEKNLKNQKVIKW